MTSENKVESFLVGVKIIEGRYLAIPNMDSAVQIQIGRNRKSTGISKSTDCPYFNEYFVFEFETTLQEFLNKNIFITVIQPRKCWRARKTLGSFQLDMATLWTAPDRQFFHKWVTISATNIDKKPDLLGPKGYIKLDIAIQTKGKAPRFPVVFETEEDDIEGNLLAPENVSYDRPRANFTVNIYSAHEIPKIKLTGVRKIVDINEQLPSSYVEVTFAGMKAKTSTKKNTQNPVWNEQIIITELFPSLCQRFKIQLKIIQLTQPITYYLYVKDICNDGENGYLPTFGPSYLYFFKTFMTSNTEYMGKLLIEIKTEIITDLMWSVNTIEVLPNRQIPNLDLWKYEDILVSCTLYSVTMIDKKFRDKEISFELALGPPICGSTEAIYEHKTTPIRPICDNKKVYCYLPVDQVMFLSAVSSWPDQRMIVYNSNMIQNIYDCLITKLDHIESGMENENYKSNKDDIDELFREVIDELEYNCKSYIHHVKSLKVPNIELEKKQLKLCIKEIKEMKNLISEVNKIINRKRKFRKLRNISDRIYRLIDRVQACWPDVLLWMLSGTKRVGIFRIPVRDILYSNVDDQKGKLCGVKQCIYLKPTRTSKIKLRFGESSGFQCKLILQMWIGLLCEKDECLNMMPPFYVPLSASKAIFPTNLMTEEQHEFFCNVYIYQGEFIPGADSSGLCDPFIQVTVNNIVMRTKTVFKTIHPVWDQILICNNVTLFGTIKYIEENLPIIDIEVYDQDLNKIIKQEFLGKFAIIPNIYLNSNELPRPRLKCYKVYNGEKEVGDVLIAAELILKCEETSEQLPCIETVEGIPHQMKPGMENFRMDVYFWGIHNLQKVGLSKIRKPKIAIQCGDTCVYSTTLNNTKQYLNFTKPYQFVDFQMSDDEEFYPPLSVKLFDSKGFGYNLYIGINLSKVNRFIYKPLTIREREFILKDKIIPRMDSSESTGTTSTEKEDTKSKTSMTSVLKKLFWFTYILMKLKPKTSDKNKSLKTQDKKKIKDVETNEIDLDTVDWWTKFYLSLQTSDNENWKLKNAKKLKLKIYNQELEAHHEFQNFNDLLKTFKIYRGKRTGDEVLDEGNIIATFNGAINIYRWPPIKGEIEDYVTHTGLPLSAGSFQHYPQNEPVSFVVRVYIIRGINLRPKDLSGQSDPYIILKLNKKIIKDKANYIHRQTNPIFGRCFELNGVFPFDNILKIAVWDWDISSKDDLIGETSIDLEKRLYTFHRGNCGLPRDYIQKGPCAWRDQHKPTQILSILCRRNKLEEPFFFENSVQVGPCVFENPNPRCPDEELQKEVLSLLALNHWKEIPIVGCRLVPEHVETRSLFHYSKPGLEQGKLQLWVDIFPSGDYPAPPAVNITPRQPLQYELRVIIWNTQEVVLDEDDFFVGEKKSDIYVMGWLIDPDEHQCTDVHYNSISGEGLFNWRFIFNFNYLSVEDKIVTKHKEKYFSKDPIEKKIPCRIQLQIWDNDTFSADDFLGSLNLSLMRMPRGAKTAKNCSLKITNPGAPTVNLFKIKRHKGWWPFKGYSKSKKKEKKERVTGKVEIEFHLLTQEEADRSPAGIGRSDPQGLPPPKRPDIAFAWYAHPWKFCKFVCKRSRTTFLLFILFLLFLFMSLTALYAFPNYLVKKLLNV